MGTRIESYALRDDGVVPNNPRLPLVLYPAAVPVADLAEATRWFQGLFRSHGWRGIWVNGIFPFHHYHARSHEVLGIAQGTVKIQFGGPAGPVVNLSAGDAAIIPAGVGHCSIAASTDLSVVGAYPAGQEDWDLKRATAAGRAVALTEIPKVPIPCQDPLFGIEGPLLGLWH